MTRLSDYAASLASLTADHEAVDSTLDTLGLAAVSGETALSMPGNFATYLRRQADAVDLPNVVVNVLDGLPYGIGFAISQLNRVSNTVGFTIDRQAEVMERLDDLWEPARATLGAVGDQIGLVSIPVGVFGFTLDDRADELALLAAALDGEDIARDTELAARMEAFSTGVDDWNAVKDTVLTPVRALGDALTAAIDAFEAVLPNTTALQSTINSAIAVFTSAAGVANSIYNSLNITVDLVVTQINLIEAIETITSWVGFVQDLIEGFVIDILETLGFNVNIFAPVENAILSAIEPVFAVLNTLQAAAASALDAIVDVLSGASEKLGDLVTALANAVGVDTLFESEDQVTDPLGGALNGDDGEDGLFGLAGDDTIWGHGGGDFLFGAGGDDVLRGQGGKDEMYGGDGNDTLTGGGGDDFVDGGQGNDTALINSPLGALHIVDQGTRIQVTSSQGTDTYWRVENFDLNGRMYSLEDLRLQADAVDLDGTSGRDFMTGTDGNDTLNGLSGDDTLQGGGGEDMLIGGAGWDVADYSDADRSVRVDLQNPAISYNDAAGDTFDGIEAFQTGDNVDQLRGDAGDNHFSTGGLTDRLYGRAGNDTLRGEDGADAFYGGLGADVMTAGSDTGRMDRFIYFNAAESGAGAGNRDVITDFVSGEDRIELSRIDADITQGFKQRFDFVGDTAFSGTAGELRFEQIGNNTLVQADRDGDGRADFEILLRGSMTLTEDDFLI